MKLAQIKDISNLSEGTVIGEITVTVKRVFPESRGEGKFGPWRVQNCIVTDGTGECKASFWIDDAMDDLVNQTITLRSTAGKKGLGGVSVSISKKTNEAELKVNGMAQIIDQAGAKATELSQPKASASVKPLPVVSAVDARKLIFQNAKLYVECSKAATWISSQIDQMSEAHYQACVSSLYVSAERAGLAKAFVEQEKPVAVEEKKEEKKDEDDLG